MFLEPLPPWRRISDEWVCADCGAPASRSRGASGIVVLACDEHADDISAAFMFGLDYGGTSGYTWLRVPWSYWLRYRPLARPRRAVRNLLKRLRGRPTWKQEQAHTAQVMLDIFGPPKGGQFSERVLRLTNQRAEPSS